MDHAFDVGARDAAGATDCDNLPNLFQPEPQALRMFHECDDTRRVGVIHPISGASAPRGSQDVACLVYSKRLAGDASALRELPDKQAIACHGWRIRPALRGQVKHPMVQAEA